MVCPYCSREMNVGSIYAPSSYLTYWLPEDTNLSGILSEKKITNCGGFTIGKSSKIGFISMRKPDTHFCAHCRILLTKLDD